MVYPMKVHFISVFILFYGVFSFCFEEGCQIAPNQLNKIGTKLARIVEKENRSLPKNMTIQSDFELSKENGKDKAVGTFEAFLRPENDDFYSLIPIPILGFDVSKDRIVVYICAHFDENPEKTHLTVYFMRGYHIDPINFDNFWGDVIQKPKLEVKPVPASLLGISEFKKLFLRIFRFIPISGVFFDTFSLLQRLITGTVGDITGFGVEKIELTMDRLQVASKVDLDDPSEAFYSKTFMLRRPKLGNGVDSFEGTDEQVLKKIDSNKVDFKEIKK